MTLLLDNIIFGLQSHGGISVYWSELLRRAAADGISWIDPYVDRSNASRRGLSEVPFAVYEKKQPIIIERFRAINESTTDTAVHSSYYRVPRHAKTKLITTVYDFTYERYRAGPAKWVHHWQKMRAIHRSTKILCISESTARDVIAFGGARLESKIQVTHLAASSEFIPIRTAAETLSERYSWLLPVLKDSRILMFVGARTEYKRFDLALETARRYPAAHLVVIGGGKTTELETEQCRTLASEQRITFIPTVSSEELPLWYNVASALLYLSDYEGFGLPILEASQCGCPVLAQNTSSVPEVYGATDFLLDTNPAVESIIERLKLLENEKTKNELVERCGQFAKRFSWDECYSRTRSIYASI